MIKRYEPTIESDYNFLTNEWYDAAVMGDATRGRYIVAEGILERLEAILWALEPCDQYDTVKLQLEQLIEELK